MFPEPIDALQRGWSLQLHAYPVLEVIYSVYGTPTPGCCCFLAAKTHTVFVFKQCSLQRRW